MDKTIQHNKTKKLVRKKKISSRAAKERWDSYFDMYGFVEKPIHQGWIDNFAKELVEWVLTADDSYKITQFYVIKGVNESDVFRWKKRSVELQRALDFAKMVLGNKREIGAIKKQLDVPMIMFMMSRYDDAWKDELMFRASLKQPLETTASTEPKIVVIERFPGRTDYIPSTRTPEEVAQEASIKNKPMAKKE